MYESHWQLERAPFAPAFETQLYYPSEKHQAVLARLRYTIEERRGPAALVGAAGTGKSFLIRRLAEQLAETYSPFATIVYPLLPASALVPYIANRLGATVECDKQLRLDQVLLELEQHLVQNALDGRHAVLVVDEAQLIDEPEVFESLRLLENFAADGAPALSLLLVGEPQLLSKLHRMPQFADRLAAQCVLAPLSLDETHAYIEHRLAQCRAGRTIFEQAAVETIHELSGGVPRRINRLCDLALLVGYAEGLSKVDAAHVETIHEELAPAA
jgi:general secretion pathway protein A